jgi:multicomponent Na+:H+ antiporter subunit C
MNNYLIVFAIIILSLYKTITAESNFKKIVALAILQNAIWLFYIIIAVQKKAQTVISNPLPNVLMLTAIVVGLATLALGVGMLIRIKREE